VADYIAQARSNEGEHPSAVPRPAIPTATIRYTAIAAPNPITGSEIKLRIV
jgi:hypothetical protein